LGFYGNDADPMDETGHGTSVASVIAAKPYTTGA
jgi:subtilisin family serine protease